MKLLAEGPAGVADQVAVHAGHRLRALLGAARLQGARPSGSSGAAGCPGAAWFLKPLAADDARRRADSAAPRGLLFQSARRVGRERLGAQGRAAPAAAARRHGRHGRAARSSSRSYRARGGAPPVTWPDAGAGRRTCAPFPTDPRRLRLRARSPRAARCSSAKIDTARRCRTNRRRGGGRCRARDRRRRWRSIVARSACSGWRSAASSTSASTASRSASRSSIRRRAACAAAQALRWYHNVPVVELAAAARPVRVLRRAGVGALSGGRAADRRGLRAARVRLRAGPAAAGAAGRSRRC